MIEAIKVIVSLILSIALLCGTIFILMNFPLIVLAVGLIAILGLLIWGLTFFIYEFLFDRW